MMTNDEILQLAKTCGFDDMIGERVDETDGVYYECWEEQLLKFARAIYEEGYEQHAKDILGELYDD
jgi:L-ribulose-5-phosphate 3-epimerase UlaE